MLFKAASETLLEVAADPKHLGAKIGILMVLHTWGQQLEHHAHVHCVVPGGGLSADGQSWVRGRSKWLLPVRVLSKVFRGKYLAKLRAAYAAGELRLAGSTSPLAEPRGFAELVRGLYKKKWHCYAKKPFAGPEQMLKYLAGYTHRVAISNHRLVKLENDQVTCTWKDYNDNCRRKELTLDAVEFVRRFSLHILAKGPKRIRHYGLLGNRDRSKRLAHCRELLGVATPAPSSADVAPAAAEPSAAAPAPAPAPPSKSAVAAACGLVASVLAATLLVGAGTPAELSRVRGALVLAGAAAALPAEEICAACGGRLVTIARMVRPRGWELEESWRWDSS